MQLEPSQLLRLEAEVHLENGTVQPSLNWPINMDTLHCLLVQTMTIEGAEASLKVLHELQVFQVELDLMQHQMAANEQLLTEDLQLYLGVFEQLPQPCFILHTSGLVHSANPAAAVLAGYAGAGTTHFSGVSMLKLLVKESQVVLHAKLLLQQAGNCKQSLWLQLQGQTEAKCWQLTRLTGQSYFLLTQTESTS